ncbi:aldehyde dehydrogenase family protein [Nocardioides marmorisolisilvae]|uniref:Aldehyde dehydrogenase n=2 Tax=Nocardioides TaxID=1839 RepID=A0A3N0DX40_9ACTN|nr:aldehyde dehydrogenase family protein [Nocardioides marmorisolisilvae]RNL80180.1 aldehyde dehydrogenase family protein [Nocardioides marmorisolisilvae]
MSISEQVALVRKTFDAGTTRPVAWRLKQLEALERMLTEGEPQIAEALAVDLGRPPNDTFLGDIAPPLAEVRFARKHLRRWMRSRRVGLPLSQRPGKAWYSYEPLGVVLVIGPWNYPVYLTIGPLVAAIAAGNCAVIKPSEHAPSTARVIRELVEQYLDPDAFLVLEGGPEVTQDILAQAMDLAFFTGGPEIGKAVMAAAAPHLTPVILELGGKCPAVIAPDANLGVAARRIAWTKLMNSGQTCIAPDYLMVDETVWSDFRSELLTAFKELSPNGDGGRALPIVSPRHAARLEGLLTGHGGTVITGGDVDPGFDTGKGTADLTVVLDPALDSPLMTEEIFGPLLPVVPVRSVDQAMEHIGAGPKPLAAYLFSGSRSTQRAFRENVAAGAIVENHIAMHVLVPELPFGGVGNSGMGAYHGKWGFEAFSHRKANLHRPTWLDPRFAYPPYSKRTERLLRKIF